MKLGTNCMIMEGSHMTLKSTGYKLGMASTNPNKLSFAVERWKDEHHRLRAKIKILETHAKEIGLMDNAEQRLDILSKLKQSTAGFMTELKRHAEWEDKEFFAFLIEYMKRDPVPTIMPSFWVLERDHELADSFFQSFHESVGQLLARKNARKDQAVEAASHLLQACLILNDHLTMEEQLVLPLTEEVFTDLDYFFS